MVESAHDFRLKATKLTMLFRAIRSLLTFLYRPAQTFRYDLTLKIATPAKRADSFTMKQELSTRALQAVTAVFAHPFL